MNDDTDEIDDSLYPGDQLPNELWLLISSYSDTSTLFTLTKVSRRLRHIAKHVVSYRPYEQFLFNFLQYVGTSARAQSYFQLSDPRLCFIVTPKDMSRHGFPYQFHQYTLKDICKVLHTKYKASWRLCKDSADKKRRIHDRELEVRNKRQTDLRDALNAKELRLRSDSLMCQTFISTGYGLNGESLSQIVDIMDEMAWFYIQTNYVDCLECIKNVHRYSQTPYDHDCIVDKAKDLSIQTWVFNLDKTRPISEMQLPLRVVSRLKRLKLF